MELLEPVHGVGDQEVTNLWSAEVEDVGAPVGLVATSGVRVLIQCLAVESGESKLILGKVAGNPVEQDADPVAVHRVDQETEVIRRAEPGGRRVVAADLISPRRPVGVFHHRHQLDVGETEVLHIVDQVLGQVTVGGALTPGPQMDLVDAHGSVVRVGRRTGGHPVAVLPGVGR